MARSRKSQATPDDSGLSRAVIGRAIRLIESRASDGLTSKDLVRELRIPLWTLRRGFEAHFSKTPTQMLKLARLKKAKELLATTELPIKQVAQKVGFQRVSNFCDFFRKQVGRSPSEFREGG